MATTLNTLRDNPGARRRKIRVGRGMGAGKGKYSGRGTGGQKSHAGIAIRGFEGGQTPIHRRLPKRGFNNPTSKELEVVNTGALQALVDLKKLNITATITVAVLKDVGLVRGNRDGVKLLGEGEVTSKLNLEVHAASKSAVAAIEKAGGKVTLIVRKAAAEKSEGSTKTKKSAAKKASPSADNA